MIATARCSQCGVKPSRSGQRYCPDCHNAYMRRYRASHTMTAEQKAKDNCRSYAGVYLRRGFILPGTACAECGTDGGLEMHHDDYSKPLEVTWMCRPCHLSLHRHVKRAGSDAP